MDGEELESAFSLATAKVEQRGSQDVKENFNISGQVLILDEMGVLTE